MKTMQTVASKAEEEFIDLLQKDNEVYRDRQYKRAEVLSLQTTYEEIFTLWNEEVKYRPGFEVTDGTVTIPAIFAKISGVKDAGEYWATVRSLGQDAHYVLNVSNLKQKDKEDLLYIMYDLTERGDASFVTTTDLCSTTSVNPDALNFLKDGKLLRSRIKSDEMYKYDYLNESTQDYMLDTLQKLLDENCIRSSSSNEFIECVIISTVLNLGADILRMINNFDFTKNNPKLIYLLMDEHRLSQEDAITAMFLHLLGFDILFFVPTGYRCIEQYLNAPTLNEHLVGPYVYDMYIGSFWTKSIKKKRDDENMEKPMEVNLFDHISLLGFTMLILNLFVSWCRAVENKGIRPGKLGCITLAGGFVAWIVGFLGSTLLNYVKRKETPCTSSGES